MTTQTHGTHSQMHVREVIVHGMVLIAVLAVVFPGVFFRGEHISPADLVFQQPPWESHAPPGWDGPSNPLMADALTLFRPWYRISSEAIRSGAWPLWNPYEFAGMPLLANYQSAVLYPPRLLHVFLDVDLATTLFILLKLWLAGMAAYLCARVMRLGRPAACFCSAGWMLASYNLIWCNWCLPDLSPWLAVLVMGSEFLFTGRYRRGFFVTALGGSLLLLAGHPVTAFTMTLGLTAYFVFRLALERRWRGALVQPLAHWAGAWALALGVCAAQLLPFLEYMGNQYQGSGLAAFGAEQGLPLSASVVFWIPRFFGTAAEGNYWGDLDSNRYSMIYPGIAVWLCATIALFAYGRDRRERARSLALVLAAGFGIALTFEVYPFSLIHSLPFFSAIKRSYHICFAIFALPLLGAIGLERWQRCAKPLRVLLPSGGIAVLALLVVAGVWRFNAALIRMRGLNGYLHFQVGVAAFFALLGLLLLAFGVWSKHRRLFAYALTAVLAVDLLVANRGLNPTIPAEHLMPETALTRFLDDQGPIQRVGAAEGGIPGGLLASYGIEEWLGEDGMYPERMIAFLRGLGPDIWTAMEPACSITHYLGHPKLEDSLPDEARLHMQHAGTMDGLEVYANTRALPRAYVVSEVRLADTREAMYALLTQPGFDPGRTALIESPIETTLEPGVEGTAKLLDRGFTDVGIRTNTDGRALLVLADAYYPGWSATVNGEPAEVIPVYSVFRGVLVPGGESEVEFRYFPASFRLGLVVSVLSLLAGAASAVFLLRRRTQVCLE